MSIDSSPPVQFDRSGHVATIALNRPDRLNAVTPGMFDGIQAGLDRAIEEDARVVVLEGNGRAFCVGADLKEHDTTERSLAEKRDYVWSNQAACRRLQTVAVPVIAKVHGYAVGGGAEIALAADIIVAAGDTRFRFPETSLGSYVTGGSTYTLPERVGVAAAKDLLMTGRRVEAAEADDLGLIDRLVSPDDLDAAVGDLADDIGGNAPISVETVKRHLSSHHPDRSLWLSREVEALLACMATDDWREGVDSFAEDREPVFKGK